MLYYFWSITTVKELLQLGGYDGGEKWTGMQRKGIYEILVRRAEGGVFMPATIFIPGCSWGLVNKYICAIVAVDYKIFRIKWLQQF